MKAVKLYFRQESFKYFECVFFKIVFKALGIYFLKGKLGKNKKRVGGRIRNLEAMVVFLVNITSNILTLTLKLLVYTLATVWQRTAEFKALFSDIQVETGP